MENNDFYLDDSFLCLPQERSVDMQLLHCYNVHKAVSIIDTYCMSRQGKSATTCLNCPLRKINPSGQYTCTVVHNKWNSAGFKKQVRSFTVSWPTRKQMLEENKWQLISFGPNVLWYKHRQYFEQKMLKKCSDEEFFSIVSPVGGI